MATTTARERNFRRGSVVLVLFPNSSFPICARTVAARALQSGLFDEGRQRVRRQSV